MKIIKYTYKFRLEPTQEQKTLLNKHFGSVRWTFNYFLNQRKEEYRKNISDGTSDYECGDEIRPKKLGTICEAFKKKGQYDPETTTSLV